MPIHHDLFQFWRYNKEEDKIKKAARFLFLSNFGYLGKTETMKIEVTNSKKILLESEWWNWDDEKIKANKDFFFKNYNASE